MAAYPIGCMDVASVCCNAWLCNVCGRACLSDFACVRLNNRLRLPVIASPGCSVVCVGVTTKGYTILPSAYAKDV